MQPTEEFIEGDDELQEDQAPVGSSRIVIWLVIFGLAILFLPLYFISTTIKATNEKLTTDLESIQVTLSAPPRVDPTQQALSVQFTSIQNQSKALESIRSALMASYVNWPTVMASLSAYDPNQMMVSSVTQIENGVRLTGRAQQEIIAMTYADMLRASGLFDVVAVESITLQSVLITSTPAPTSTPDPAATPSPTPTGKQQANSQSAVPTMEIKVTDFIISVTIKKATTGNG